MNIRHGAKTQRGAAALIVTALRFFAMLLVVAAAHRSLVVEARSSANQYRSTQAFEAAEAGLEWALAKLNDDTRLGDDCLPGEAAGAASFRDRHLRYDIAGGTWVPATWNDGGTPRPLQAACVRGDSGWTCSCPSTGVPSLPAVAGGSTAPAFAVELAPGARPGLIVAVATGCTAGTTPWSATADTAHEAAARIEVAFGLVPGLRATPVAALTARGDGDAGDAALGLHNRDAEAGGLAVDAGGHVAGSALRLSAPAGSTLGASIVSGDASLSDLAGERFFKRWFGMGKAAWIAQLAVTRIVCTDDCGAAVAVAVARGSRLISVSGDLPLDGPATPGTPRGAGRHRRVGRTSSARRRDRDRCRLRRRDRLARRIDRCGDRRRGHRRRRLQRRCRRRFHSRLASARAPAWQQRQLRPHRRQLEGLLMSFRTSSPCVWAAAQRGTSLLESLIAFIFLSLGTMAVVQLEGALRLHADLARQRSEAVRLGERELESLRAYSVVEAASGASAYAAIVDAATVVDGASGYASNTSYRVVRRIDDDAFNGAKAASISVEWIDRHGGAQSVVLDSVIARNDPVYSGALALPAAPRRGAFGRSPRIPVTAKSLGEGRSAWKPAEAGSTALVFDDASGHLVSRCTGVAATTHAADLTTCASGTWLILSGTIRFTSATPPVSARASEVPLSVAPVLTLAGGSYPAAPDCSVEAMKTVRYVSAGSLHLDAVPIDAAPTSIGVASWDDTGDRFASYRCIVTPRADGRWSGRATLAPGGWTIGSDDADRRICRFAGDLDGSGAIDANIEHPADYVDVSGGLTEQNFLVVRGSQACPGAPDDSVLSAGLGTVQQQP
jgi:Tfp pilus assembly protein PilV